MNSQAKLRTVSSEEDAEVYTLNKKTTVTLTVFLVSCHTQLHCKGLIWLWSLQWLAALHHL